MSFKAVAWVLEHSEARGNARLVLLTLAEYAHDDGSNAFPSVETIAHKCRISKRSAQYALTALRKDGWIEKSGTSQSGTTVYSIPLYLPVEGGATVASPAVGCTRTTRDVAVTETGMGDQVQLPAPPDSVEEVWSHYVATMKPRATALGKDERKVIRAALEVATVAEVCRAISACKGSRFHMGENDRRRKYNKLSQIVKGRPGKETTRERIDFFLDLGDEAALGGKVPSGDPAVMANRKRLVQRGWRFSDDPEAVREAREAEEWLTEHGIEVVRGEDQYPTFRVIRPGVPA